VSGIAKRVEDGSHFQIHIRRVMPDIGHRHTDQLGERALAVHADADGVLAKVPPTREAVATATAHHMTFRADDFARVEIAHVGPYRHDFPDELMPDHHRYGNGFLRPGIPFVNVEVGAADAGFKNLDEHVIDAHRGFGNIPQPQSGFCFGFDECLHDFRDTGWDSGGLASRYFHFTGNFIQHIELSCPPSALRK